jgi:alpha-N-arabinofuranosidase
MKHAGISNPRLAVTELQMFARVGRPSSADAPRLLSNDTLVSPATAAEALYDVLIYHAAIRLAPFVEMVTHSATVNHGGGLRKTRERVYANPCYYAQSMFAAFTDAVPVKIEIRSPTQAAPLVLPDLKNVTSARSYKTIDALAAKSKDGRLLVSIVHRGTSGPIDLEINIEDFASTGGAEIQTLTADVPWAANSLEKPEAIIPVTKAGKIENGKMLVTIKPYAVLKITISRPR